MVPRTSNAGNPGRKRGPTTPVNNRRQSRRIRQNNTETPVRVFTDVGSDIEQDLRESPAPIDPATLTPCSRLGEAPYPCRQRGARDTQLRTPSTSPVLLSRDRTPGDVRNDPARKDTLRAKLQDVVRIVIRQNIIRKLTAKFANPPPSEGRLTLCPPCERLELAAEDFVIGKARTGRFYGEISPRHGTFIGIYVKAHVCPLCRLIMKSIAEQPFAKLAYGIVYQKEGSNAAIMSATCSVGWQVDGVFGKVQKTRRLRIKWSDPCYETIYLVMVSPRRTLTERQFEPFDAFLGRELAHVNKTKTELIGDWFKVCKENHHECQPEKGAEFETLRQSAYFGVIDVTEMRFRPLPEGADYAALSYQWGPEDPPERKRFTTTLQTVMHIQERNGLSHYLDRLPTSIREAIELVRELRLKYLWIDSLCIVQNAGKAWDRNAAVMDLIYGNAVVTICAADGEDAYAGLCAISKPETRARQSIEPYNSELTLMARYPCEVYIKQSNWNTRAWTFQERLLSKRCLLFTQGRVYFQCRKSTMCEDLHMEKEEIGSSLDLEESPGQEFKNFAKNPVKAYEKNVAFYTARKLTKPGDVLSAFCGVAKLLCEQLGGEPVYGLPSSHFDFALLWDPEDAPRRRGSTKSMSFPSWSWCGWTNRRMEYKDYAVADTIMHLHNWLMNHTWITWYIRDGNGNLRLVWDAKRNQDRICHLAGTMCGYKNKHGYSDPNYDYYGRKIPECRIGLERTEFTRTIPEFPLQVRTLPPGDEDKSIAFGNPDRSILQFWTWSAYFYLHPESPNRIPGGDKILHGRIFSRRFSILDAQRNWVGTIVLDKKWKFDPRQPQHFIAISDALQFWYDREGTMDNNYSRSDDLWPLYNVLLLGYDEMNQQTPSNESICTEAERSVCPGQIEYRVGLGKIYQEAFERACETSHQVQRKQWREIVLG